jgi:hypothetical protein
VRRYAAPHETYKFLGRTELHHIDDETHVRSRWENPLLLRDVFFENIGLQRAAEAPPRNAFTFGRRDILRERDRGGTVNRHRRRDLAEIDAFEQGFHIAQRVDRDAAAADFAERFRSVGIETHERGHIEGDGKTHLALREEKMVALVRLFRVPEARELAHRPQAIAVAARVDAARIRILARSSEVAFEI